MLPWSSSSAILPCPIRHSEQLRARARQALMATATDSSHLASYHALFLGDRSGFSHTQSEALSTSGLSHLMVISGLHVGLMATLMTLLLRFLARRLRLTAWRVPVYLGTVISLLAYLWLVDYAVPVLRATIMALLFIALTMQRRRVPVTDYWLLTLTACVFYDPFAFASAGFWLSFGAVAVIALVMAGRPSLRPGLTDTPAPPSALARLREQGLVFVRWLSTFWRVQWQLFSTLSVLLAVFFQQVSLAGLFTNLVAIPLVTLLLVPVGFLAIVANAVAGDWPLLQWLIALTDQLFDLFWILVESGKYFPVFATQTLSAEAVILLLLLSVPTLWCWHLPFAPWLHLSKLLLFAGVATAAPRAVEPATSDQLRFIVFDVGQGHAALLDDGETSLLFDTGPIYPVSSGFGGGRLMPGGARPFNPAADQVLPYLVQQSAHRTSSAKPVHALDALPVLDYLVVSHADHDHAGGAGFLLQHLDISHRLTGEPEKLNKILATDMPGQPAKFTQCLAGQSISSRAYTVTVLWPLAPAAESRFVGNDLSCVLKVTTPTQTILLTGDVEKPALKAMVDYYNQRRTQGNLLDADILVLPHHGSRSSFMPGFISAVSPEQVVIPAGANNRFGHPHQQPVDWLSRRGVKIWNTGTEGYFEHSEALPHGQIRPES